MFTIRVTLSKINTHHCSTKSTRIGIIFGAICFLSVKLHLHPFSVKIMHFWNLQVKKWSCSQITVVHCTLMSPTDVIPWARLYWHISVPTAISQLGVPLASTLEAAWRGVFFTATVLPTGSRVSPFLVWSIDPTNLTQSCEPAVLHTVFLYNLSLDSVCMSISKNVVLIWYPIIFLHFKTLSI